ncbi:S-layer homology domain-containing protein [Cohnella sp. WQ 127256]|uniref:S-layer homology domain-containing protein n=1 Tax=Cohnella sp. WQ 127256 TaxID=2938790 RepID=UPI0021184DB8|nr:S-layer homology domain-containing protein [Cohnella sp. WQ 127256]
MPTSMSIRKSLVLFLCLALIVSWGVTLKPASSHAADPSLASPLLESPVDGSFINSSAFTLQWSATNGAEYYYLMVATDADFDDLVFDRGLQQNSFDVTGLVRGIEYYWQVEVYDADDNFLSVSDVSRFKVFTDSEAKPMNQPVETLYSGTEVTLDGDKLEYTDDTTYDVIELPFPFTFYGETYEDIYATSNGYLLFDPDISVSKIAPFHYDLYVTTKSKVVYTTIGDAPNRKFVMQYTNMLTYNKRNSTTPFGTFQIILYESTNNIQFQYPYLVGLTHGYDAFGANARIGIFSDTDAVKFSDGQKSLREKQAIRFTPSTDEGSYMMSGDADYESILLIPDTFPDTSLLGSPADGSYVTSVSPALNFNWANESDATKYRLLVSTNAEFMNVVKDEVGITSTSVDLSGLEEGTKYYWKVVAYNATGNYTFSNTNQFVTIESNPSITVETDNASLITSMTATVGGNVSATGIAPVAERGIVYSLNANPTYSDNKVAAATGGTGVFTVDLAGLQSNSTYHVRAYAISEGRITYGQDVSFTTLRSTASLSSLSLSGVALNESVSGSVYSYTARVPYSVSSTAVTATVNEAVYRSVTANVYNSGNSLVFGPINLASGVMSSAIPLNVGMNKIEIVVLSLDDTGTTYTVTVTRAAAATPPSGGGGGGPSTVTSKNGKLTLPVGKAGEVSLDNEIELIIPANASKKQLELTIEKMLSTQGLLSNKEILASSVFEILKNFTENFDKPVTITLSFDPSKLKSGQTVAIFYYDEVKKVWVKVEGGKISKNRISADVNHFTKFAALVVDEKTGLPITEQSTEQPKDTTTEVKFSDIKGHWAEVSIKQAVYSGIVKGYTDGTFKPNATVTRAEFAVMLMNALKPSGNGAELSFSDNAKIGSWAQKAIAQAVQANIIKGFSDGTFRPNEQLTRAEMASIIANALKLTAEANATTGFADDSSIPTWAKGAVSALKKLELVSGKGGNKFDPKATTTRAEAVTVLLKMLEQASKK